MCSVRPLPIGGEMHEHPRERTARLPRYARDKDGRISVCFSWTTSALLAPKKPSEMQTTCAYVSLTRWGQVWGETPDGATRALASASRGRSSNL